MFFLVLKQMIVSRQNGKFEGTSRISGPLILLAIFLTLAATILSPLSSLLYMPINDFTNYSHARARRQLPGGPYPSIQ